MLHKLPQLPRLSRRTWIIVGVVVVLIIVILSNSGPNSDTETVTASVTHGTVAHIVSVTGVVEADSTAALAFPVGGVVADILVSEGDMVEKGDTLALLEQSATRADRQDAYAAYLIAVANRDELLYGPQDEQRAVTNTSVAIAEQDLARTTALESEKVENARRALYSEGLEALPVSPNTDDVPPTISGTYICESSGVYTLSVFQSNTRSGYSFSLSGLEGGIFSAYTDVSGPMGSCGLSIQFDDSGYSKADWTITVPNIRASEYVTNYNAYQLALQTQKNNVAAAEQALALARGEQTLENTPRAEAIQRANAQVTQAAARLAAADARIADRTLTAPFTGIVNNIDIVRGETVGTTPVVTVVADDLFELTARIPEIDITRLEVGQRADVVFDARTEETLPATVIFISPLATEIDGVAYFEAKIQFPAPPTWLRGGLNADVEIVTHEESDVLRIPKRFLIHTNDTYTVLVQTGKTITETPVTVGFIGNDGFVAITGLTEGAVVVAP
ncbi:HlyD family efflux transporter periplasmic adaptor subunit [Candidatus Kaiserbacteria bacterium]|nr:HlyD family efflux transporter periplasmic adaptor subunit [Candidatus Kaiserbacteria bacterium]